MKKAICLPFAMLALGSFTACGDDSGLVGDDQPEIDAPPMPEIDAPPGGMIIDVPAGDIDVSTTWTKNNVYVLKGYVWVTGGTLTIEAGTVVRGDNGSALTITKDAKLNAVGTMNEPIVFTSSSTTPRSGDWGGLVVLGKATINVAGGTNGIEGFATSFGERIRYGGTDNAHDCGKLRYARIEFAGFELAPANELNGLTLGGCGSATEVDYVQSHYGLDDGIEVFGGTVNLRHLVISSFDDDGLDWDLGWKGTAQFVIVQQRQDRGDKGIEADNHPSVFTSVPFSAPEIWNLTMIGGDGAAATKKQGAWHLRRGTGGKISNAVVAYWNTFALDVDGFVSRDRFGTDLTINHTYFLKATPSAALYANNFDFFDHDAMAATPTIENDCDGPPAAPGSTNCFNELTTLTANATNRMDTNPMLTNPKDPSAPNFAPMAGSPVLTGCGVPPAGLDTTATFCGAIGTTDWTAGWTAYPASN
ncbi:MAG: hypothetical protein ACKV2T_27585 [Kofleriaceae bacterium]